MKAILKSTFCLLIMILCACSGTDQDKIKESEAAQADINTAIMEGRTAARAFINVDPTDTLTLHTLLIDARAKHSKYVTRGLNNQAQAFDTAFIHTLRAASPEVARAVEQSDK